MITLDDAVVLGMIAIAVGFIARRIWRRVRPRAGAAGDSGCGSCGGCGTSPPRNRRCGGSTDVRAD
jgi:hypothetical protein